ncbi:MAG: DUF6273 domain-containing protein [Spirochaetaceae bacterium]|jgi:hypothetical protein|nr:DUF6273 domain-containing protein [Spirochaetaceae bacterium]
MANLIESGLYEPGIYQWEVSDGPEGGVDGIDNVPTRQLASRAGFLNDARLTLHIAGKGRNLLTVLGVSNITQAMAELRRRCNNNGEIDSSKIPDFRGIREGDYLDLIDLSGIAASVCNGAGQAWNNTYKNNRIIIVGFNTYKYVGDTDNTKNHILFQFANVPLRARMNPTNDNTGGYSVSEMRVFLDGLNGDGTGDFVYTDPAPDNPVIAGAFLNALKAQIGNYILPIRRLLDGSTFNGTQTWAWKTYSLFLLSEENVYGSSAWGRKDYGDGQKVLLPYYANSWEKRRKNYNGSRDSWWLMTPYSLSAAHFAAVTGTGHSYYSNASAALGCAPDSVRRHTVGRMRPSRPTQKERTSCCDAGRHCTNIRLDTSGRTLLAWQGNCEYPVSCPVMLRGIARRPKRLWGQYRPIQDHTDAAQGFFCKPRSGRNCI